MRRNSRNRRAAGGRIRLTVGLRLLLALAGLVSFSTAVALTLQDRALARDLEKAASQRLDRAASAARRLIAIHVASLEERYRAISGTPQLRANLEVQHAPTLAFYADDLQRREGMRLLAFIDREGSVTASSGDASLLAAAMAASRSGLVSHDASPYFVTLSDLRTSLGTVGRLVAVDDVPAELVAGWSELCGAPLAFESPAPDAGLSRVVASLPGVVLRVAADLGAERDALRHSRANLLIAGAVSLALSLLASAFFARSFVSPIRAIQHAADRVRAGDLTDRIGSTRLDEIGDVARAFDAMQEHLRSSRAQVDASFAELTRSRTHLDNAQRRARIGSFELDLATGQLEGSRQLLELYRMQDAGKSIDVAALLDRIHPDDRQDVQEALGLAMREDHPASFDFRVQLPDGEERLLHGEAHRTSGAQPLRLEGTIQDVTDWRRAEEQIRFLAYHDGLTGLGNRRLFTERVRLAIDNARRRGGALGVLFLDLDHFKRINDTLGHTIGDELLRAVAERLAQCVRATDTISRAGAELESAISRFGGDEFTILIEHLEDPQRLSLVASRVLEALEPPFVLGGHDLVVGASIGIAAWPVDGEDVETLLRNADAAMYHAKEHGRNQYQFYTDSMNAAALQRLELEHRMRTGLLRGQLEVHYQPKLDLTSQTVTGFEALVRWRDPQHGMVMPGAFIPIAEQSGMIVEIGSLVLDQVCEQIARWEEEGAGPPGFHRVSVNVSARQFEGGELVRTVREALQRHGASPERLELEITESTVMHDERSVIATLGELRSLGVAISLDDFGTGYSSLSYLRSLPVDTLKIDMAFVRNIASNDEDAALTAAIVSMGKARGLRVVAEGVESLEQRRLLRAFGCDEIQGFLIAAAMPAQDATGVRGASFADPGAEASDEGTPITQSTR